MKFKQFALLFIGVVIVAIYVSINPTEVDFLPKCPFYFTTGLYCPGCGSQRATHQFLNFNFIEGIKQNILFAVSIVILLYHFTVTSLNTYFKKNIYNYLNHQTTGWVILIFIVSFWIIRNLPFYPFNLLAPK
jgi:uncharacterized membrane protein